MDLEKKIIIGKIVGVHGTKGLVKILSFTEKEDEFLNYSPYYLDNIKFNKINYHFKVKKNFICELPFLNSREKAKNLVNKEIFIEKSNLPLLGKKEFYQNDLIGFKIKNCDGHTLGNIIHFHDFGAGVIAEVEKNKNSYFLPINKKFLIEICMKCKEVIIDLPSSKLI